MQITGATGHIGNVLVRELTARGQVVRALVLPNDDCRPLAGLDVEIIRGNVIALSIPVPSTLLLSRRMAQ